MSNPQRVKSRVNTLLLVPSSILWEGLARMLSTTDYRPIKCTSDTDELLGNEEFNTDRTLVLISADIFKRRADVTEAPHEVKALREEYPNAYLIVMSSACAVDEVIATLRAGANGYLQNTMTCEMLTKSFDLVMAGETVLPAEFTRSLCERKYPSPHDTQGTPAFSAGNGNAPCDDSIIGIARDASEARKLSGRELAIISRLLEGDSNKIIARRIGLAEATVKTHVKAILRKIGVKNRTQAALWALHHLEPVRNSPEPLRMQAGEMAAHAAE